MCWCLSIIELKNAWRNIENNLIDSNTGHVCHFSDTRKVMTITVLLTNGRSVTIAGWLFGSR